MIHSGKYLCGGRIAVARFYAALDPAFAHQVRPLDSTYSVQRSRGSLAMAIHYRTCSPSDASILNE